jgi:hypothetical protein
MTWRPWHSNLPPATSNCCIWRYCWYLHTEENPKKNRKPGRKTLIQNPTKQVETNCCVMCNTGIAWWWVWQSTLIVCLPPTNSFSRNQQIDIIMEDMLLNKLGMQIRRPTHHQFLFPWTSSQCTWKKHPSRFYGLRHRKTLRSLQRQKSVRLHISARTSPVTRKKSRQTDDWMNDMAQLTFKMWLHLLPPSSSSRESRWVALRSAFVFLTAT